VPDKRTAKDKWLWDNVGEPLYYCSECLLSVAVKVVDGGEPIINRPCDCNAQIIAPRKAVCVGEGMANAGLNPIKMIRAGMSLDTMKKIIKNRVMAALTGRNA